MTQRIDVAIVGGGPIGIETAITLRKAGYDARVFEAGPLGHTISWWAPQTRWFSSNDRIAIAGVPLQTIDQSKASREEYLNYLRGIVDQFDVPVETFTRVQNIQPIDDRWDLSLPNRTVNAKAVVLAIGGTDKPNRLKVPGEDLPHVDGYLRECHRYHRRRVLIVGGRNSAIEAAIRLHRAGAKVALSYHRPELPSTSIKYWLRPEIDGLIRSGAVRSYFDSKVIRIDTDQVVLELKGADGLSEQMTVLADDVLALIGYRQNSGLFEELGIMSDLPSGSPVFDPETMACSRDGIYVAGTAIGGTQSSKYQVFLENCHDHGQKILSDLQNKRVARTLDTHPIATDSIDTMNSVDGLASRIELQPES